MLRLFIATPLGQQVEQHLASVIEDLRPRGDGIKWVTARNIHLTLRFLGDTDDRLVPGISSLLNNVAAQVGTIQSQIDCLGGFPNLRRPRVIWAGINGGVDELSKLAKQIEHGVRELGFERDSKEFKAHLTLGRVRDANRLGTLAEYVTSYQMKSKVLLFDRIVLFKSTLTPQGPIYERLHEAKLMVERFSD